MNPKCSAQYSFPAIYISYTASARRTLNLCIELYDKFNAYQIHSPSVLHEGSIYTTSQFPRNKLCPRFLSPFRQHIKHTYVPTARVPLACRHQ